MLSLDQFANLYEMLTLAFGQYKNKPAETGELYYQNLKHFSEKTLILVINRCIKTCSYFPSIKTILDEAIQLEPPPDPTLEDVKTEASRQERLRLDQKLMIQRINNLPEHEKKKIYDIAEQFVPENIREWLPMKTRDFLVDMKAILVYKERFLGQPQPINCLSPEELNELKQEKQFYTAKEA